jgi:hypothetical protein
MRCRKQTITRESEDSPAKCLHCCEADELDDNHAAHGEKDTTRTAKAVVVNLSNWLRERAGEDIGGVALRG